MNDKKENPFRPSEKTGISETRYNRAVRGLLELRLSERETYDKYIEQLREKINGGNPRLLASTKFAEWSTEDFRRLLDRLESRVVPKMAVYTSEMKPKLEGASLEEIKSKADYLRKRKEIDPRDFRISVQEIQEMAEGENPQNIRQYYKEWTNGNFTALLKELADEID